MNIFLRSFCLAVALLAGCAADPPITITPCQGYCYTYEDGYQWALKANLSDERACTGYGKEFIRGCLQEVTDLQKSFAPRDGF